MDALDVYLRNDLVAQLRFTSGGKVSMHYVDTSSPALSLSLPNDPGRELDHRTVHRFFDNLLPDNSNVRERWARSFSEGHRKVSAKNPFALLSHMGQDVAGALQILPAGQTPRVEGVMSPISRSQIGDRLGDLERDRADWVDTSRSTTTGRFSLAGAQSKIALTTFNGRIWFEPTGAYPSTHIFKPSIAEYSNQDLVEHISQRAAGMLGLNVAGSQHMDFDGHSAIVSTRYDREVIEEEDVVRIHQEDLCQALGVPPEKKYQDDGGPNAQQIVRLLRQHCPEEDAWTFVRSLAYAWAIQNTDGHAKNYSLLHGGPGPRLAPLYDICSAAPYEHGPQSRDPLSGRHYEQMRLAFKIGSTNIVDAIGQEHWVQLAQDSELDPDQVMHEVHNVVTRTAEAVQDAVNEIDGPHPREVETLVSKIHRHTENLALRLPAPSATVPPRSHLSQPPGSGMIRVEGHMRRGRWVEEHWRKRPTT